MTVELGVEKCEVETEVLMGMERDRLYAARRSGAPIFAQYKDKSRVIPVVALRGAK